MRGFLFLGIVCADLLTDYSKIVGLFQTKFGSNMDKPKCWVKNLI